MFGHVAALPSSNKVEIPLNPDYALEIVKCTKNGCQSRKSPYPLFQRGKKKFLDKSSISKQLETMRFVY